ncbi:MAG: hypothetical protein Q8R04_05305 [Nanoarchaeota archaeon]|nr:hypothetical protein [Nanoarchaeota archaeon]
MKISKILNVKQFKKWLEKEIGKRCKDYCWDCFVCRSWRVFDEVESYVDHIKFLEKPFPKKTKLKK